jgi:hypothetical protein
MFETHKNEILNSKNSRCKNGEKIREIKTYKGRLEIYIKNNCGDRDPSYGPTQMFAKEKRA